jgi:predicted metalloprotease with PDZ domain
MYRFLGSVCFLALLFTTSASGKAPDDRATIVYRVTVPEPEHHWLQVEATFPALDKRPLNLEMSQSSPGRYALHGFAKNVFWLEAYDGKGRKLAATRPSPFAWNVAGHDGTVRVVYKVFGDRADGTYLGVDTSHAHMNMPATFLWADGLEERPARFIFVPPAGSNWKVATQLYPTSDPFTFTAPNLQYWTDSPTEFADVVVSTFSVPNANGRQANFRIAVHPAEGHDSTAQADVDELAKLVQRLVVEQEQVFGEFPEYEPGAYTFLLDYSPSSVGDGMEHRNSTMIGGTRLSLKTPQGRTRALGTISHEFFHNWNVRRIRPVGLEPFDFARANITCCLWVAEGFTQYYGPLLLFRAGLSQNPPTAPPNQVINGSGRMVRSAVEMSEYAVFGDGATAADPTDRNRTFISYYTYGSAIALALDLSLREKSQGKLSLDDYMKLLWTVHGKPGGRAPGLVAKPYSLKDLRDDLAQLTNDRAFADNFFDKYVEGREVADYTHLLSLAGYIVKPANPDRPFIGQLGGGFGGGGGRGGRGGEQVESSPAGLPVTAPTAFNTPLYEAGVDMDDTITTIDGSAATSESWDAISKRKPGDKVALGILRRDGTKTTVTVTLKADPALQSTSAPTLTTEQQAFRDAWLHSKIR